eukprot:TRINITY_DN105916_c0_g1_i1.p1 TRINITY_DN105916_c0_g1~~TRINITY_DN105916_c0_g1_i1.p1  ORF type:complete len:271 (-),score=22.19 TRINITY_DN105916_c0_g1_i1:19-831(-)
MLSFLFFFLAIFHLPTAFSNVSTIWEEFDINLLQHNCTAAAEVFTPQVTVYPFPPGPSKLTGRAPWIKFICEPAQHHQQFALTSVATYWNGNLHEGIYHYVQTVADGDSTAAHNQHNYLWFSVDPTSIGKVSAVASFVQAAMDGLVLHANATVDQLMGRLFLALSAGDCEDFSQFYTKNSTIVFPSAYPGVTISAPAVTHCVQLSKAVPHFQDTPVRIIYHPNLNQAVVEWTTLVNNGTTVTVNPGMSRFSFDHNMKITQEVVYWPSYYF